MCCTFGDLTDVHVVARAAAADPRRSSAATAGSRARPPSGSRREPGRALYAELAGKTTFSRARGDGRRCCASPATSTASRQPTQRMANFYEKGDKPLEIVTTRQWYIRNGGRDAELRAELIAARRRDRRWHPAFMRTATRTGSSGLNGDWLISPAALLRRAVPGLVPARRRRRARLRRTRSLPDEADAAGRPVDRRARRATTRPSAASPAASSATPTSWTPGPRRR